MPRTPLPFLLALELAVVGALGFAAWHLVSTRTAAASAPPPSAVSVVSGRGSPRSQAASPPAQPPPSPPPAPRPSAAVAAPKLSLDAGFWQLHLTRVNSDESALERVEWRTVEAAEAFARAYIDGVVLPAIRAAQRGRS